MKNVFLLSGISGSGKSTWIKNNIDKYPNSVVLSTDALRKEYNMNETSEEVFPLLRQLYADALNNSEIDNIFIDSTCLSRKRRLVFKSNSAKIIVVLFFVSLDTAYERVKGRGEVLVPYEVIKSQLRALTPPVIGIDCDEIVLTGESFFSQEKLHSVINTKNVNSSLALIKDVNDFVGLMTDNIKGNELLGINREHRSSFHAENIDTHINLTISKSKSVKMRVIALFHDLGKPLSRKDGKVYSSFVGHEKYSSIMYLNFLYTLDKRREVTLRENDEIALAIFYHMLLFKDLTNKALINNNIDEKMLDLLIEFNVIDKESSIPEKE